MMLMDAIGGTTPEIESTIMELLFNGVDSLLGGNYNTFLYQRNQVVSNKGKLIIDAANNPLGIALTIDFGVPKRISRILSGIRSRKAKRCRKKLWVLQ